MQQHIQCIHFPYPFVFSEEKKIKTILKPFHQRRIWTPSQRAKKRTMQQRKPSQPQTFLLSLLNFFFSQRILCPSSIFCTRNLYLVSCFSSPILGFCNARVCCTVFIILFFISKLVLWYLDSLCYNCIHASKEVIEQETNQAKKQASK